MKKYICLVLSLLVLLSSLPVVYATETEPEKYIYRTDTYDFDVIDADPMFMSDEAFFGK